MKTPILKSTFRLTTIINVSSVFFLMVSLMSFFVSGCKDDDDNNTFPIAPVAEVTTQNVIGITQTDATTGGIITSDGGSTVLARGVCWGTITSPTVSGQKTIDGTGTGSFTSNITGLSPNTSYFVRAYATNGNGTAYGQQISFMTNQVPDLNNSLQSYWKLDEISGTTASDAVGSWDLSFVATPGWSLAGKINGCIDFGTVSNRYLERTGIGSGDTNTYTLAAWINLKDSSANAKMIMGINSGISVNNAGAAEVKIYLSTDNKLVASYHTQNGQSAPMLRIGTINIPINNWVHVAGVINNGNVELYINGLPDNGNAVTNIDSSNLVFTNGRVTLGTARLFSGSYNTARWFRGEIDEAGIWTRPLPDDEIQTLYNSGNGLQYPF